MAQRDRPPLEAVYVGNDAQVDIIAVHGMAADVDRTWTWKDPEQTGRDVNWLRDPDMLPNEIPKSRILLYNYDTTWLMNAPKTHLQQCGQALIRDVHIHRKGEAVTRPIIFIGHSLGGNVIQNAILFPNNDEEEQCVVGSTVGVVLLGSPLCGVQPTVLPRIAAYFMQLAGSHDDIIKELRFCSPSLVDKTHRFCNVLQKHSIACFCFYEIYETDYAKKAKIISKLIPKVLFVEQSSATIHGFGQAQLRADHFQMNKFSGPSDPSFTNVAREVSTMFDNAVKNQQRLQNPIFLGFNVERTHTKGFQHKPPHFVERPALLRRIEEQMFHSNAERSILYLHGMTGSGKTFLGRHFGRSHAFTARFELPGKTEAEFRASLAKYAEDVPDLSVACSHNILHDSSRPRDAQSVRAWEDSNVARVLAWLNESGNTRWFILIDDIRFSENGELTGQYATDPELNTFQAELDHWINRYVDALKQGSVIITSQNSRLVNIYPSVTVGGLQEDESIQLLETVLDLPPGTAGKDHVNLARALGNHALSVDTAAQYLSRYKNVSPARYLELWKSDDVEACEDSHLDQRMAKGVDLAIKSLEPKVQNFLRICAFLDPDCIWPGLFPDFESRFDSFTEKLGRIALVAPPQRDGPDGGFSIHPAVHRVVRNQVLSTDMAEKVICTAIISVAQALPEEYEDDLADQQRYILPHIEQCLENLLLLKEDDVDLNPAILPSLRYLGWALERRGQIEGAKIFYTSVLTSYEAIARSSSTSTHLADRNLDDLASDASLDMEPDYYIVVNSYGQILEAEGDRTRAQHCFSIVRQSFDRSTDRPYPESFNTAEPLINLALCLRQRGRLDEAEWSLKSAEAALERCDDVGSRIQKHQIAQYRGSIYKFRNELVEAGFYVEEAVSKLENELKGDSLEVALAQKELGAVRLLQATEESLPLAADAFEAATRGISKHCQENSITSLDLRWHKLMLRLQQCRIPVKISGPGLAEACREFDEFITHLENILPRNDPFTLHSIRTYGKMLGKLDKWDTGRSKLMRALEGYKWRQDDQIEAAFTNKDLGDGFFVHSKGDKRYLGQAKRYFQSAKELFDAQGSDYATTFSKNIEAKLEAIDIAGLPEPERQKRLDELRRPDAGPGATVDNANDVIEEDYGGPGIISRLLSLIGLWG